MSYIVAIDVGIKNMGICVYSVVTNSYVYWNNVSMVEGVYNPSETVGYVINFINNHKLYFDDMHVLLVERQMRCNMRIVQAVFETLYYGKCKIISPRSVKMHYGLSTRNYAENKRIAVAWVTNELCRLRMPTLVADGFYMRRKKDDMADSLLLLCYFLHTYSN